METQSEDFTALMGRVSRLKEADPYLRVFGSGTHGYQLGEPCSEGELSAFEADHDVAIPSEFRRFLKEVGNGGAGPYYGLYPLRPFSLDHFPRNHVTISDADGNELASAGTGPREPVAVPSSMSRPFQLSQPWSPLDGPYPFDGAPWDGCLELAQQGCGYFDFLVVKGPRAGEVWSDFSAGDGSITKAADSFLEWYEKWVDHAEIEWAQNTVIDVYFSKQHVDYLVSLVPKLEARVASGWQPGIRSLGYASLLAGDFDAAKEAFRSSEDSEDQEAKAKMFLDLTRVAIEAEQFEEGLKHATAGLELNAWFATEMELLRESVWLLETLKRFDDAYPLLQQLVENEFNTFDDHFQLAWRQLSDKKIDEGHATLKRLVTKNIGGKNPEEPVTTTLVKTQFNLFLDAIGKPELKELVQLDN